MLRLVTNISPNSASIAPYWLSGIPFVFVPPNEIGMKLVLPCIFEPIVPTIARIPIAAGLPMQASFDFQSRIIRNTVRVSKIVVSILC